MNNMFRPILLSERFINKKKDILLNLKKKNDSITIYIKI